MMDVLPIPPVPMRAIDVKSSAELTILWTNASRPKKTLGGGGGNSPRGTLSVWVAISVCSMIQRERVAYRPILATNCLAHFHHNLMRIDGHGVSGSSYGVCVCCYCMSFGC